MPMFFRLSKKSRDLEAYYDQVVLKLGKIETELNETNKTDMYLKIKEELYGYFSEIFSSKESLTEEEIIKRLGRLNIESATINKVKKILELISSIEYNNTSYNVETLYNVLEQVRSIIREIEIKKEEKLASKQYHVFTVDRKNIEKIFPKILRQLKDEYSKKKKISPENIIKLKAYFDLLAQSEKEKFAKEVNYYTERLPEIIELVERAKEIKGKNQEELHQIVVRINHFLMRLDDNEKNDIYPMLLSIIDSSEEKLNIYLMFAYSFVSQKRFNEAYQYYGKIQENYNKLEENKKKYYYEVIKRFSKLYTEQVKKNQTTAATKSRIS